MSCEIHVGFITDIDELRQDARRDRMAVRRAALAELSHATKGASAAAVRYIRASLAIGRAGQTAPAS